jgi:dipeptidyl aminopeptidase/acylaminoacyl peptidase
LLIIGAPDTDVLELIRAAARQLRYEHRLVAVPGATHLFEEPGALEEVSRLASNWFAAHLVAPGTAGLPGHPAASEE